MVGDARHQHLTGNNGVPQLAPFVRGRTSAGAHTRTRGRRRVRAYVRANAGQRAKSVFLYASRWWKAPRASPVRAGLAVCEIANFM